MRRTTFIGLACSLPLTASAMGTWGINTLDTGVVGIAVEPVGSNLVEDGTVNRTVRLYATMDNDWRLDAVAGNTEQPLTISVNNGTFYQNIFGGNMSTEINSAFFSIFPELQWDSFVTIGGLDANGTPWNENNMSSVGVDWTNFSSGGAIDTDNASWYVIPTEVQGEPVNFLDACGRIRTGVCIGQFTLVGAGATLSFNGILQGKDTVDEAWQQHFSGFTTTLDDRSPADVMHGCAMDLTGDDTVNVRDLLEMLSNWTDTLCMDFNADMSVDVVDLTELIAAWGACPSD